MTLLADLEIPQEVSDEVQSEILGDPAEDALWTSGYVGRGAVPRSVSNPPLN